MSEAVTTEAGRLRLLYDLGCAFAERVDLDELLPLVLDKCREVLAVEAASVLLLDTVRNELYFPYVAEADPEVAGRLRRLRFPADRGIAGAVLQGGRSIRVDDVSTDPTFYGAIDRRTHFTTRALLCAPLTSRQGITGVLQVLNPRSGRFSDDDLPFLDALAGSVAVAIENARLYGELKRAAAELEQKVIDRTRQLSDKNRELEETLGRLKSTQEQLLVQEKLASLGALTAGIAHEIKNPLNFVNNFAQLSVELCDELSAAIARCRGGLSEADASDVADITADLQQNARKIHEHGQRADGIVRGMLQHSRGGAAQPELTDLNALLAESVNLAYHGMRAQDPSFNVALEVDYDPAVGNLSVVTQDLSRVFLNILNNACYAANERRKAAGDDFVPAIAVRSRCLGDRVEIRIRDNGGGIPAAVRDRIFLPFFTTKPTGVGTGLGLSISHDIVVQQHHGELRVDSEEDSHTELIIVLPRDAGTKRPPA